MSALGQKRTLIERVGMRFVPKADIRPISFDYVVGKLLELCGHLEA